MDKKSINRIPIIDIVKGICIIMVIIEHYAWKEAERLMAAFPFWISMAVPVFMLVSGYVYTLSLEKKQIHTLEDGYRFTFVCKKIIRYTIPLVMAFFLLIIVYAVVGSAYSVPGAISELYDFMVGAKGAGGYYYPIMLQFVFVFPLIYFPIKKNPRRGLFFSFLFNFAYEVLKRAWELNESTYRVLLFRYVFLIAFGCFLFYYKERIKWQWLTAFFMVGTIYIIMVSYFHYVPKIFNYWSGTSLMASLYIIPVFYVLIKNLAIRGCAPLELLGRASYNIFLVQMVYYCDIAPKAYTFVESRAMQFIMNIMVCIIAGILFYFVESKITKVMIHITEPIMIRIENKIESMK